MNWEKYNSVESAAWMLMLNFYMEQHFRPSKNELIFFQKPYLHWTTCLFWCTVIMFTAEFIILFIVAENLLNRWMRSCEQNDVMRNTDTGSLVHSHTKIIKSSKDIFNFGFSVTGINYLHFSWPKMWWKKSIPNLMTRKKLVFFQSFSSIVTYKFHHGLTYLSF